MRAPPRGEPLLSSGGEFGAICGGWVGGGCGYRGTSLIRNSPLPEGHHRALGEAPTPRGEPLLSSGGEFGAICTRGCVRTGSR